MNIKRFRIIYIILVVVLLAGFYSGRATSFRLLSVGSTISAALIGPTLVRHK